MTSLIASLAYVLSSATAVCFYSHLWLFFLIYFFPIGMTSSFVYSLPLWRSNARWRGHFCLLWIDSSLTSSCNFAAHSILPALSTLAYHKKGTLPALVLGVLGFFVGGVLW